MFQSINADIITLQELKVTQKDINNSIGKVDGYHSFLTIPSAKKGYSGVGVYVRIPGESEPEELKQSLKVIKAEEGVTGILKSHDTGESYRSNDLKYSIGGYPQFDDDTAKHIDSEGRAIVIELARNIVIISTYCPANSMGTEEGENFRVQFIVAILQRIRNLQELGKHVILMGDINISRDLIDSADSLSERNKLGLINLTENETEFEIINKTQCIDFIKGSIPKMLLNEMLIDSIYRENESKKPRILIDTVRKIQGRKQCLYTVWNTIRNSRPNNYGSRIDLILTTEELGNTCNNSHIWPFLMGSDHCPVFSDFNFNSLKLIEKDWNCIPIPKLEAKYVYKLSSGKIDMLFSMKKRSATQEFSSSSSSSSPSPSIKSSQESSSTSQPIKKIKIDKPTNKTQRNSITSFFKSTKKPQIIEKVDINLENSSMNKVSTNTLQDPTKESIKFSSGKFMIPNEAIPHCKHNQPCVLKTAKTVENKGKKFWSCAKDPGHSIDIDDGSKYNCGYFKWK
ncbi:hypothetical protein WICMUC_001104 [Wickerhamomyces mucosus]|uniref:DNA-(apurinic or apyrimidinic site) endonuclease 2 n=1 Tax=Wickerhamomyces mucosus TaxID=1378264 RepID=A0A9P8THY0_9ASCO|nr:hypothetical protein WICMUC_001104 [Wickerhamomyces mucosus]